MYYDVVFTLAQSDGSPLNSCESLTVFDTLALVSYYDVTTWTVIICAM